MKVTMVTLAAGPQGIAKPGTVLDVNEAKAKELIEGNFARQYDPDRDRKNQQGFSKPPESFQ